MGLPRYCSASGMFAEARTDCFHATMRKRAASLVRRVRVSPNIVLVTIAGRLDCTFIRHCSDRHVALPVSERSHRRPKEDYGPMEVVRSVLLNGIGVAATHTFGGHMGACTIMYQAGSRHEVAESIGACHFVRAASTTSSCAFSGFIKMRCMAQHGVSITCTSDRQSIAYTLRCPVASFAKMKCYLLDTVLRCCFKQWEIDDLKPMVKDDLHRIHPLQRVIDLAQRACWAGPLSNSLFCEASRMDEMSGEILNNYTNANFKADHCSVASVGMPYEETIKLAEAIEPRREKPPSRMLTYSRPRAGFELYDLGPDSDTWICVVVPSCGTSDLTELFKHSIIAHACGTDNVQEGSHTMDNMPELPIGLMSAGDLYTTYKTFNIAYYETGVFGVVAKTRASTAWKVAKSAAQFLAHVGDLDSNQINAGKKRLQVRLALHDEDCVKLSEGLALQAANRFCINNAQTAINIIDCLSNEAIKNTAMSLSGRGHQMAYAVVGDVGQVPYDTDIRPC